LKKSVTSFIKTFEGVPVFMSTSTLKVISADMNLLYSPTIMMFEQAGQYFLKASSIGTGATFSPPAPIIISLILPVIFSSLP